MQKFDLIVIGSGPGGYVGAIRAAQLGLKVAIIEKDKSFGGTCLNVGCIPSKILLESSEHYHFAKQSLKAHGIHCKDVTLNLKTMIDRKNKMTADLTKGIQFLFKKNKITSFQAWASLRSATEVDITLKNSTETLQAKNILLATGSSAIELPFAKWDKDYIVSSTEALNFSKVPQHLVIIGGGYIGLELGSVWSRLGSKVTVIESNSSICSAMDKDLKDKLFMSLKKQGFDFHLSCSVTDIQVKNSKAQVQFTDSKKASHAIPCDKVLVCVGRRAFTKNLGLQKIGLKTNALGKLEVNSHFQTHVKNIFAVGDLIDGPMLAHKAEEEAVAVAEYLVEGYGHVNYKTIPSVIYTWPEASSVGQTEQQLIQKNQAYSVGRFPFAANGRARSLDCTEGFVKILACKKTDKILGVHILGPRAGDLIAEAVLAMEFHASSEDLARTCHAHPSLSEAIREASLGVSQRIRQM